MSKPFRPTIAFTPGEPAGIGLDLAVLFAQKELPFQCIYICDANALQERADQLQLPISIECLTLNIIKSTALSNTNSKAYSKLPKIQVLHTPLSEKCQPGKLNLSNAQAVINALQYANDGCMQGIFDAIVTGPVQKSVINDAGIAFSGHTEFFAQKSGTAKVVMMLATNTLRVALATTHLPLKDVASAITKTELHSVLNILAKDLHQKFGIDAPTILVCGLNPHAGEGGHLGTEEIDTIIPVIEQFNQRKVFNTTLIGPLPADTLFTPKHLQKADAVLAMYHDQGLPVLKFQGFGNAVNITLGLPYIRTSVDHGTALDLAGSLSNNTHKNINTGSLDVAFAQAYSLVKAQQ